MGFFELLVALLRGFAAGFERRPVEPVLLIQLGLLRCQSSGQPLRFTVQVSLDGGQLGLGLCQVGQRSFVLFFQRLVVALLGLAAGFEGLPREPVLLL